jgi:hypothetical protein
MGNEFYADQWNLPDGQTPKPWEDLAHSECCTNPNCTPDYQSTCELKLRGGSVLPLGHMICSSCNEQWTTYITQHVQQPLTSCLKDDQNRCYTCALRDPDHRAKLRKLLIRGHLSCMVDYLLPDLALSSRGHIVNILTSEVAELHTDLDQRIMLIPGWLYSDVLSLLSFCIPASRHQMTQFVATEFPMDRWGNNCRRELCIVDTRRVKTTLIRPPELTCNQTTVYKQWPPFTSLRPSSRTTAATTQACSSQLRIARC